MALPAKLLRLLVLPLILTLGLAAHAQGTDAEPSGETELQTLIDVLESDAARADLIERLKAEAAPAEDIPEVLDPADEVSVGRKIAAVTQNAAEEIGDTLGDLANAVTRAPDLLDALDGLSLEVILGAIGELLALILGTIAIFVILRTVAKRYYRRLGDSAVGRSRLHAVAMFLLSALIDLLIVIIAWAAGYALALLALGDMGDIAIRQSLYLNAFLLVEVIKVGVRMVLSPSSEKLRLLPMEDPTARGLNGWVTFVVSLVGYGQLLVVPIVNREVSYATGSAVTALIALIVVASAVIVVLRNRNKLAAWLTGERGIARSTGGIGWLARHWHWPVLAYLFAMFVIVMVSPPNLVFRSLTTSGQVVLVVLAGIALSSFLTRIMQNGIRLGDTTRAKLPLLESRLNRFVPRALAVVRLFIVAFVVLFTLNAINLVAFTDWLASEVGLAFSATVVSVALILIVAFGIWVALTSFVDYRLNPEYGTVATSREQTLLTLARNAGTITLLIITLMFVLAEVGLNIAPLLASAGVLGLAIGFGAQKFVQDIITGLFIQFENAINVGDIITVGGTTGTVERLTIRSVSLRDLDGVYHIIPFSSVDMVSNYTRDFGYFVSDMGVAYRESVDDAKAAMIDAFEELRATEDFGRNVIGDFEWFGVQALADSAVVLRARIKCVPGTQFGIGRMYNEICKRIFDARGIEIPFPHQTIYLGEAKDGTTQTFNVASRTQIEGRVENSAPDPGAQERAKPSASASEADRVSAPTQDAPADTQS